MKFNDPDSLHLVLCFACGNISPDLHHEAIVCPDCGEEVKRSTYRHVLGSAMSFITYGVIYRRKFERQLKEEGSISTHYAISEPEAVLCFLGVAAVSGVVGGIAYDVVKTAARRIFENAKNFGRAAEPEIHEIDPHGDIDEFIRYAEHYFRDQNRIDCQVLAAIREEKVAWALTDMFADHMSSKRHFSEEDLKKEVREALLKSIVLDAPSPEDVRGFWMNL